MTSHIRREEIKVQYYRGNNEWTYEFAERKIYNTAVDATTELNQRKLVGVVKENEAKFG